MAKVLIFLGKKLIIVVLDETRVARPSDIKGVAALYKAICDHQPLDKYGADWTWGEYPSVDGLQQMIENATVMIGLKDQQVVAGGVLTTGEEYPQVEWPHHFANDEIGILHLPEPFLEKVHIALQLLNVFLQLLIIDPAEFFHFLLHMPHPITSKSIASLRQKRKPDA